MRRAVPEEDQRARRALEIIDSSLARLLGLVNAAQRHRHGHGRSNRRAARTDRPRAPGRGCGAALPRDSAARDIGLAVKLDRDAVVRTAAGMMEIVLQNVLENATSAFLRPARGSPFRCAFPSTRSSWRVDDEGPGIDAERIDSVFQRYSLAS